MRFLKTITPKTHTWKAAILLSILLLTQTSTPTTSQEALPAYSFPKRELRGAWIATVHNIDWPSRKFLSPEQQRSEFEEIVQSHKKTGINALFVQVRTAADAFYAIGNEPWSEWLTGEQGKPPYPIYDPLPFMIQTAHDKEMEFHAWLNLNRGTNKSSKSLHPNHPYYKHPEWFYIYDGHAIFNFGLPEVQRYIIQVVQNIVKNYDVDGIHFDDYFYPYTIAGQTIPDEGTFQKYGTGFSNIEDWRRHVVTTLIKDISSTIRATKPWVKFGISPFGVWRNQDKDASGSPTNAGQTSYDNLYADGLLWLKKGYIDYLAPQVYFSFESPKVPYASLTSWWAKNNYGRPIYIGHASYKVNPSSKEDGWDNPNQISRQLSFNRQYQSIQGSIFFNTNSLKNNELGLRDKIQETYKYHALTPLMPWKGSFNPLPPKDIQAGFSKTNRLIIKWTPSTNNLLDHHQYVIYKFLPTQKIDLNRAECIADIVSGEETNWQDTSGLYLSGTRYFITTLDRLQNESLKSKAIIIP